MQHEERSFPRLRFLHHIAGEGGIRRQFDGVCGDKIHQFLRTVAVDSLKEVNRISAMFLHTARDRNVVARVSETLGDIYGNRDTLG